MNDPADVRRARRIAIVSLANGASGLSMGLIALAASLWARDTIAAAASCGLCAGAATEILGSTRAARHEPRAAGILIASQVVALASVLGLVLRCSVVLSPAAILGWMPASTHEAMHLLFPEPGEVEATVRATARVALGSLALVAALLEGGMAIYYGSSKAVLTRLADAKSPSK